MRHVENNERPNLVCPNCGYRGYGQNNRCPHCGEFLVKVNTQFRKTESISGMRRREE
jgi:DNA-directed RNA polymerase subunit RPC12/RpoP